MTSNETPKREEKSAPTDGNSPAKTPKHENPPAATPSSASAAPANVQA